MVLLGFERFVEVSHACCVLSVPLNDKRAQEKLQTKSKSSMESGYELRVVLFVLISAIEKSCYNDYCVQYSFLICVIKSNKIFLGKIYTCFCWLLLG